MKTSPSTVAIIALAFSTAALGSMAGCSTEEPLPHADEHVGTADQALTADQCNYFDVNGTIQICHQLGNGKFSILKLSEQACINAYGVVSVDGLRKPKNPPLGSTSPSRAANFNRGPMKGTGEIPWPLFT